MIMNVVNRLKRVYPDLYASEQFNEYELIHAQNEIVTKVILVDMNMITGDLYASFLSVKVTRDDAVVNAVYNQGSTEFLFSSGDILYSYTDKRNEKKLIEITQNQLSRFLGGDVMDFVKSHFKMKYGVLKIVEKVVTGK
jgi:hypothetical protein